MDRRNFGELENMRVLEVTFSESAKCEISREKLSHVKCSLGPIFVHTAFQMFAFLSYFLTGFKFGTRKGIQRRSKQ